MFRRYFRIVFWRNRSRYWRKKYRDSEASRAKLVLQAEAERWRNQSREDMFVSASVMGSKGMFGVLPRTSPAEMAQPKKLVSPNLWDNVSGVEKMEFQEFYLRPGLESGHSRQAIETKFFADRASRKALNDEPMN